MAVPRNRMSNARKKSRRAHMAKSPKCLKACPNCNYAKPPHESCLSCGYYNKTLFTQKQNDASS